MVAGRRGNESSALMTPRFHKRMLARTGAQSASFLCFCLWQFAFVAGQPSPGGERTLLLVDDHHVLYRSGTERVLQQPMRHAANPVIAETKPWELAIGYCSIYRDPTTGKYQAWYQSYAGGRANDPTRRVVVCYATSNDGIAWTKPNLGLYDFNGQQDTNIVLVGNGGRSVNYCASVIVDPRDSDPGRRYKMAYWDFVPQGDQQRPGLCVAFSSDGVHWQKLAQGPLLQGAYGVPDQPPVIDTSSEEPATRPAISDVIDVMYDPKRKRFVIYSKTWIDGPDGRRFWKRAAVRTESQDFVHWSAPQLIMAPADHDPGQIHGAPTFLHQNVYFSLVQRLDFGAFDDGGTGNMPSELASSRDGIHWQRPFQDQMFLAVTGRGDTFDAGCLWTNATPVFLLDGMRFYYGAYPGWNSDLEDDSSGIGLRTLPRDRFVAIQPREKVAQVTLKPIRLDNVQQLTINADASDGTIQLELLNSAGYRVEGFTKDQGVPIRGDNLRHPARWKNKSISDVAVGGYQLRMHMDNAKLFALTIHQ